MAKTIEKVYAGALLEVAEESNNMRKILDDLLIVKGILDQLPTLLRFFCIPIVEKREKFAILNSLFQGILSPYTFNFLQVLIDVGRFESYFPILEEFQKMCDFASGVQRAVVWTAYPVGKAQRLQLQEKMERMTGKQVCLEYRLDSNLVGGIVIDVGDRRMDNSIKSRLEQLRSTVSRSSF